MLAIIAVLSLSFLIELTLLGNLRHDRDQAENFSVLRQQLAEGTAPVAPVDEANRPLPAGTPVAIIEIPKLGVRYAGSPLPPPLSAGQGRLTLTTADGAPYRPTDVLRVDAQLTSTAQSTPTQLPARSLPANEAIGVGDDSALAWVVLWSAALVAGGVGTVWVRYRTGLWQAWIIGVPVLVTLGLTLLDEIAALLPNLM